MTDCLLLQGDQPEEKGEEEAAGAADDEETEEEAIVAGTDGVDAVCLRLKCGHSYHSACLQKWLVDWRGGHCPTCRAPVLPSALS